MLTALKENMRRRLSRQGAVLLVSIATVVAFVVILLGPSLVGLRTFAAVDLLETGAPWDVGDTNYSITNRCVSDTIDGVFVHREVARDSIIAGDPLPLQSSGSASGHPLFGEVTTGMLSPLILPTIALDVSTMPAWVKLLEIVAILAGMIAWFRRLGLSVAAGATAGMVYATTGFMVMWTGWSHTATAAIFPLLLWGVERVVQDRKVRSAWPLAAAVAATILGGFVAVASHGIYLAAAYAVLRARQVWRSERTPAGRRATLRTIATGVGAAIVGVAVAFAPLVSFAQSLSYTELADRSNQWRATLNVAEGVTAFFGVGLGGCGTLPSWSPMHPVEGNVYVGAGAMLLAVLAATAPMASRLVSSVRGFLVGATVVTGLALFWGGAVSWALHLLPLMSNSLMTRLRDILGLSLAALAGIGLDYLIRRDRLRPRWWTWVGVGAMFIGAAAAGYSAATVARDRGQFWEISVSLAVGASAATIVVVVLWLRSRHSGRRIGSALLMLVPALIGLQGGLFAHAFWPTSDGKLYEDTDTTSYLQANIGDSRIAPIGRTFWGSTSVAYGLRSVTAHTFMTVGWSQLLLAVDPTAAESPTNYHLHSIDVLSDPLLDRMSAAYGVQTLFDRPRGEEVPLSSDSAPTASWDGSPLTFTMEGSRLRGLGVALEREIPAEALGYSVHLTVSDGMRELTQTLPLRSRSSLGVGPRAEGPHLYLPIAAEGFADSDQITLTLTHDSPVALSVLRDPSRSVSAYVADDNLRLVRTVDAQIYERPDALGRIRWTDTFSTYSDTNDFFAQAREIPAAVALLDEQTAAQVDVEPGTAQIDALQDTGDSRVVNVNATAPGLLVIADAAAGPYKVTIDGKPAPLYTTDLALMAVNVPAGDHEVVVSYAPAGWGIGKWVSIVALTAILAFAAFDITDRLRRRRRMSAVNSDA